MTTTVDAESMEVDHGDLRYGLDLNDLNAAASIAIRINRRGAGDPADRFDTAWSAAAEYLYASADPVTRQGLVEAACRALDRAMGVEQACHGVARSQRSAGGARGTAPRFAKYWTPGASVGPDERIVESLALAQIWPLLPAGERESLAALAAHGDADVAAVALGMTDAAFKRAVKRGRFRFRRLWLDGEPPKRLARTGKALRMQRAAAKRRWRLAQDVLPFGGEPGDEAGEAAELRT